MTVWVALLRGINVGGRNVLPMAQLKASLESLDLKSPRTYIQSGNVAFVSRRTSPSALARDIARSINEGRDFEPGVFVLSRHDFNAALDANPFPAATAQPKSLHLFWLERPATPERLAALEKMATPTEAIKVINQVLYLHAPDGIGRSKLAAGVEKTLKVGATARNWRTASKLQTLAAELA